MLVVQQRGLKASRLEGRKTRARCGRFYVWKNAIGRPTVDSLVTRARGEHLSILQRTWQGLVKGTPLAEDCDPAPAPSPSTPSSTQLPQPPSSSSTSAEQAGNWSSIENSDSSPLASRQGADSTGGGGPPGSGDATESLIQTQAEGVEGAAHGGSVNASLEMSTHSEAMDSQLKQLEGVSTNAGEGVASSLEGHSSSLSSHLEALTNSAAGNGLPAAGATQGVLQDVVRGLSEEASRGPLQQQLSAVDKAKWMNEVMTDLHSNASTAAAREEALAKSKLSAVQAASELQQSIVQMSAGVGSSASAGPSPGTLDQLLGVNLGLGAAAAAQQLPTAQAAESSMALQDLIHGKLQAAANQATGDLSGRGAAERLQAVIGDMASSPLPPATDPGAASSATQELHQVIEYIKAAATTSGAGLAAVGSSSTSAASSASLAGSMSALRDSGITAASAAQNPVDAARQLQSFISGYSGTFDVSTDERIQAAMGNLQSFIDENAMYAPPPILGDEVYPTEGGLADPAFHNYLVDGVNNTLGFVQQMLRSPMGGSSLGDTTTAGLSRADAALASVAAADAVVSRQHLEQHSVELSTAAGSLRNLVDQIQDAGSLYDATNMEEQKALQSVIGQLSKIADKITFAASQRMSQDMALVREGPSAEGGGQDPVLTLLDGIYGALVVNSGFRNTLISVKELGDDLATSMESAWSSAPQSSRLVAYIAATAGVAFLMRSKVAKLPSSQEGATSPKAPNEPQVDILRTPDRSLSNSIQAASNPLAGARASPGGRAPLAGQDSAFIQAEARLLTKEEIDAAIKQQGGENSSPATPSPASSAASRASMVPGGSEIKMRSTGSSPKVPPPPPSKQANDWWGLGAGTTSVLGAGKEGNGQAKAPQPAVVGASTVSGREVNKRTQATARTTTAAPASTAPPARPPVFTRGPPSNTATKPPSTGQYSSTSTTAGPAASSVRSFSATSQGVAGAKTPGGALGSGALESSGGAVPAVTPQTAAVRNAVASSAASVAAAMAAAAVAAALGPEAERLALMEVEVQKSRHEKHRALMWSDIKDRLGYGTLALGPISAVVPGGASPVREQLDRLIEQLEGISPTDKPLNVAVDAARMATVNPVQPRTPMPDPDLIGEWKLVYTSDGRVSSGDEGSAQNIFAQVVQLADSIPGFGMENVVQRLSVDPQTPGIVKTESSTVFSFGPLGSWQVRVEGSWRDQGGGMCASSSFETFSVRPVSILGVPFDNFPEVSAPVPKLLMFQSSSCTTYLDKDTRVSRDSDGSLSLFKKT